MTAKTSADLPRDCPQCTAAVKIFNKKINVEEILMKGALTDGKGKVWVDEVPMPETGDYECLCKIDACATCTGTDKKGNSVSTESTTQQPIGSISLFRG